MPLTNSGWEMQITRKSQQTRSAGKTRVRTVGTYQIFHDGVAQTGSAMSGTLARSAIRCRGRRTETPIKSWP